MRFFLLSTHCGPTFWGMRVVLKDFLREVEVYKPYRPDGQYSPYLTEEECINELKHLPHVFVPDHLIPDWMMNDLRRQQRERSQKQDLQDLIRKVDELRLLMQEAIPIPEERE